jgi:hypothetical protein
MADEKTPPAQPSAPGEKKQTKAIPGKPVEGSELRKETVRINLPPKLGDQAQPGPAPTVRLPSSTQAGAPATVKLTQPGGQTTVLKPSGVATTPKKSDTAQVLTTVLPPPSGAPEPKPTVKLKGASISSASAAGVTAAMPPATTVLTQPMPPAGTAGTAAAAPAASQQVAAPSSTLESILSILTAVLAIGVAVLLFMSK